MATNAAMPGLAKIGFTDRDPDLRLRELNNTSVPADFKLEYELLCGAPEILEHKVHGHLDAARENPDREFFKIEVQRAIRAVRETATNLGTEILYEKWHNEGLKQAADCAEEVVKRKELGPDGTYREWHDNGELKYEGKIREGKPIFLREYYSTGQQRSEGLYNTKGRREGNWRFWDEEGLLYEEGPFKDGVKHGSWKIYVKKDDDIAQSLGMGVGSLRVMFGFKDGKRVKTRGKKGQRWTRLGHD